jgi:hypothetical protein
MSSFCRFALVLGSVFLGGGIALGQARLGPYVVDSNGTKVGHLWDSSHVFTFIDGQASTILIGRSGLKYDAFSYFFAEAGCVGTPYLQVVTLDDLFSEAYYTTDGVIHYVSTGSAVSMVALSSMNVHMDGSLGGCDVQGGTWSLAPALTVPASTFTPPFSVVDSLPVSPAPATATFLDVPTNHPFFQFIEALHASGITGGCQSAPPLYCPDNPVTRGQMAVFLAKALGL